MSAFGQSVRAASSQPVLVRKGLSRQQLADLDEDLRSNNIKVVDSIYEALCIIALPRLKHSVNAIFMGPPTNGLAESEIVQAFRQSDPEVRLVLLLPEEESQRAGLAITAGFNDAFSLPAAPDRLKKAIDPGFSPDQGVRNDAASNPENESTLTSIEEAKTTARRSIVEVVLEEACFRIEKEARSTPLDCDGLFEEAEPEGDFADVYCFEELGNLSRGWGITCATGSGSCCTLGHQKTT